MKKLNPRTPQSSQSQPVKAATGEHCPMSGWWHPVQPDKLGTPEPPRFVGEGSVMPAIRGISTIWIPT